MDHEPIKMHQSSEDYLEAILMITKEKGTCRSVDVANKLGFRKSSVSVAMAKLAAEGFIEKKDSGELFLTEKGLAISTDILERHEFFMNWLMDMGVEESVAYEDACCMEHAMSADSFRKIKEFVKGK